MRVCCATLGRSSEARGRSSTAEEHSVELDFLVIAALIQISRRRYDKGDRRGGERASGRAAKALEVVRAFISTADQLSLVSKQSLSRRCDELEQQLLKLTP
jgi:hypothetical protein